jgi:hypothetical protein
MGTTPAGSGPLAPDVSMKVGQIIAMGQAIGINNDFLQFVGDYFKHGAGFGNPFALNSAADTWASLQGKVGSSSNDVDNAVGDLKTWTGDASDNFVTFTSNLQKILPDIQADYGKMSDGLRATASAGLAYFTGCAGVVGGIVTAETGVGAIVGAIVAIAAVLADRQKIDEAKTAFVNASNVPPKGLKLGKFPQPNFGMPVDIEVPKQP